MILALALTGCPPPCGGEGQECCLDSVACAEGLACTQDTIDTCQPPHFDADYRDTYTLARDCRRSMDHDGLFIQIFANEAALDAYSTRMGTLPDGSVLVKEEHADTTCADDPLGWAVMRRDAGFRPLTDDWSFQFIDTEDRALSLSVREECVSCHLNDCMGSGPGFDGTCAMLP